MLVNKNWRYFDTLIDVWLGESCIVVLLRMLIMHIYFGLVSFVLEASKYVVVVGFVPFFVYIYFLLVSTFLSISHLLSGTFFPLC